MKFRLIGKIQNPQTFASGSGIRELSRLQRTYGKGNWRKRKGIAEIEFEYGIQKTAEIHWYEATGIGKKEHKIKRVF